MDSKYILKKKNPNESANFISKILVTWTISIFKTGYKNGVNIEDIWQTRQSDLSEKLTDRLEIAWQNELNKAKKSKNYKPSLSIAIARTFWLEYMISGIIVGLTFIVVFPLIPYTLGYFIEYFAGPRTSENYKNAHIYVFLINLFSVGTLLLFNHGALNQSCTGMRVRIACCSLVYRKILKLNHTGINKTGPGHVINLMSNDVNRFDIAVIYLHFVWIAPIVASFVSYLVWKLVSWATLSGLAVMLLQSVVIQVYLSKLQGSLRGKIARRTDERVKVMNEVVSGIQVIKMYSWETPFQKVVDNLRKLEVKFILRTSMIKGFSSALGVFTERFILYATLVTFVYIGGDISSGVTFALVQYFNLLQLACNILFPTAMSFFAEARVSIKRLEEFLALDEVEDHKAINNEVGTNSSKQMTNNSNNHDMTVYKEKHTLDARLIISEVTASWEKDSSSTLKDISLSAAPGEFIGIAGLVGSGKSSLLHLILGELVPSKGSVSLGGARVAYASQEPWLFVATVRQNILFGLPYDPVRYKKVVTACALIQDFKQLPSGDSTLVGERGASLSGGQRARISLARACYRQADIYLLDDPLSAVDAHVSKHLMSECLMGLLQHSTRLLVTHQLHHLKTADKVVVLNQGAIDSQGSFEEVSRSPFFTELMQGITASDEAPSSERQRSTSIISSISNKETSEQLDDTADEDAQETDEMINKGRVAGAVYKKYFCAGNGWAILLFTFIIIVLAQVVTSAGDLWLTHWMNNVEELKSSNVTTTSDDYDTSTAVAYDYTDSSNLMTDNDTFATNMTSVSYSSPSNINHKMYINIWTICIFGCIGFTAGRAFMFLWVCMRSSVKLHNQMFGNILAATMRFFDANPSGRILNRFSKDMGIMDEILPRLILDTVQVFMVMTGILVMVAIVNPYMLLTTVICAVFMYLLTIFYLTSAQSIKRVEAITRSPVFSHVSASMAGLTTVRACGAQGMLRQQFDDKQDVHTAAWYLTLTTNAAFSIWLSIVSASYVIVASYIFLLMDGDGKYKSGNVGLAISQGLILVNMVQLGIKQATDVISQMTSVERVVQFTSLPQEQKAGSLPPAGWPQKARVIFKDLYLRYDEEAEPVLKNLNVVIESGWKVGVVGRTGAGKSSLISALFRLAPIDGHVYIDDIDTGEITLKALRSKISIIPQEPVLFSASLRYNMDPFDQYQDADIWNVLEQVELKSSISSLSVNVTSGGTNFSAGQRQLLCLARAALARNKLLVLDEATANVDPNTDAMIQRSLRRYFTNCTVITVAHRLHTIADADRVIVMEAGQIMECGHPHELLRNSEGHFHSMVKQLGPTSEQKVRDIARNAYTRHNKNNTPDNGESSNR
ncbi:ATP-binding cassette sub-family C member 4-like [Galleria mellonella]|uniref:ATP-binding cassette sub-family C member 4-like n=1 Tax=Galleria mellonella TaxID=7137 RepID=A0A6J1X985_GALME|nr:ATP-binding cassette sub-family C member 4-like [Galleria mellonella]